MDTSAIAVAPETYRQAGVKAVLPVKIRWMIEADMDEVNAMEKAAFDDAWTPAEMRRSLKNRNVIGMVAEAPASPGLVGFMVYELEKTTINLLTLAVRRDCLRQGVGAAMLDKLKSKLSLCRRTALEAILCEVNLSGQQFMRSQGLVCDKVLRGYYDKEHYPGLDAYRFRYHHPQD